MLAGVGALSTTGDTPAADTMNIRGEGKHLDRISREQGIPRDALRRALERIKDDAGLRGNENVDVLPDGTVVDRTSGDEIGNIHDED